MAMNFYCMNKNLLKYLRLIAMFLGIFVLLFLLNYHMEEYKMKKIKRCTRCIMDNSSDKTIKFDDKGQCNYCTEALRRMEREYFPDKKGEKN